MLTDSRAGTSSRQGSAIYTEWALVSRQLCRAAEELRTFSPIAAAGAYL
jgi:hypothetical protein